METVNGNLGPVNGNLGALKKQHIVVSIGKFQVSIASRQDSISIQKIYHCTFVKCGAALYNVVQHSERQCVLCSLLCAVCSVQGAVSYVVQSAVCNVQCEECCVV